MLLRFRLANYRSFRHEAELILVAGRRTRPGLARSVPWRGDAADPLEVLPVVGVFGANASGKSNLLKGLQTMANLVRDSFKHRTLRRSPFGLDPAAADEPTLFEVDFVLEGTRYQYGFEYLAESVVSEWLYTFTSGRRSTLFERSEPTKVRFGRSLRGDNTFLAKALVRQPSALMMSIAGAVDHDILRPIFEWFERNFWLADSVNRNSRAAYTGHAFRHHPETRPQLLALLRAADLGITSIDIAPADPEDVGRHRQFMSVMREVIARTDPGNDVDVDDLDEDDFATVVLIHEHEGVRLTLDLDEESLGTQVWLSVLGPVVDALTTGAVLLADEIDSSLHPLLVAKLVELFQNRRTNPNGAQLIFNAQDPTPLGPHAGEEPLSRDQVWFAEKDRAGRSKLKALADFDPRTTDNIELGYLRGRYGAIPALNWHEFEELADLRAYEADPSGSDREQHAATSSR
jgi:uncharacterized protein